MGAANQRQRRVLLGDRASLIWCESLEWRHLPGVALRRSDEGNAPKQNCEREHECQSLNHFRPPVEIRPGLVGD